MARRNAASQVALGGVLAALATVIQCLGGLIPLATFVCPMLCILLTAVVCRHCGTSVAWAWYGCVAILSALLGPDKEAAAVFAFLGYYPIVKGKLDTLPLRWLWKALLFNAAIGIMYVLLIRLLGMEALAAELEEMGLIMGGITLLMGNVTFFLLDRLLKMRFPTSRKT